MAALSVKCAMKIRPFNSCDDLRSRRGTTISGTCRHPQGGIHQKLGSNRAREAVKHPLQTWYVDPDVRARGQRHNERRIKHAGTPLKHDSVPRPLRRATRVLEFRRPSRECLGLDLQVKPDGSGGPWFVVRPHRYMRERASQRKKKKGTRCPLASRPLGGQRL